MSKFLIFLVSLLTLLLLLVGTSCSDDLATGLEAQPLLSADTLDLGLCLAGNSTPTYQVKLYNHCDQELRLTSITLREAGHSGFRINVDGMMGTGFTHSDLLRIASGDSLFIFVEATFPRDGQSVGLSSSTRLDYIDILCNGRQQSVVLTAQSKEVQLLQGAILTTDTYWPQGTEVQIYDSLVITAGVTLTIADSSILYLHDKAHIEVLGTLCTLGTPTAPVIFRGDRTDRMFYNLEYDNLPSQWGGLHFAPTSAGNVLSYTDIHSMSEAITFERDSLDVTTQQASLRNCRLVHSGSNLILGQRTTLSLENCLLSNAAGALLYCEGGAYDVVYCTLANYNFAAVVSQEALVIADTLDHCHLTNTLIWGDWFDPDVRIESESGYRFDHCLLRASGADDNDFLSILWHVDPEFLVTEKSQYTFDFHLQETSPARQAALPCDVSIDLEGHPRSATPTIGCYE